MFENVQNMLEITPIQDPDIPGFQVALEPVVQWLVRELRLHGQLNDEIELSLKLDGRPFFGKSFLIFLCTFIKRALSWINMHNVTLTEVNCVMRRLV